MGCLEKENMSNNIKLFKDTMIELMYFLVLKKHKLYIQHNRKKMYKKESL